MTTRSLRDAIQNALDFLSGAELVLYANRVSMTGTRVSWHAVTPGATFLLTHGHTTAEQYLAWVSSGSYSAALRDGSLLQLTYDMSGGVITGHRLAYVPCPVVVDEDLLNSGEPIADVVPLYLQNGPGALTLRSPIRFDFDLAAGRAGHPASHFSVNSPDCRLACVAPMHPYRFIDFVFRHFYPRLRRVHEAWFDEASARHAGPRVLTDEDGTGVHLTWPLHAIV